MWARTRLIGKEYRNWYRDNMKFMRTWLRDRRITFIRSRFQDTSVLNETLSSAMSQEPIGP